MAIQRTLMLIALTLTSSFIAVASGSSEAHAAAIKGVWACEIARLGSTVTRPVTFVFHSDGTFAHSSQSTVNGGPFSLPFTGRGGGHGEWKKVGPTDYAFRARENLHIDGNAGGFNYTDSVLRLDATTGQLCSGKPECAGAETKTRITQFTFDASGNITGEIDLLPANSQVVTVCTRLAIEFPGLP